MATHFQCHYVCIFGLFNLQMKFIKLVFLASALLFPVESFSQFLPDSLYLHYEELHDTAKIQFINKFVQKNYRSHPLLCQKAIEQSIALSIKYKMDHHLALSYSLAGVLNKNAGDFASALDFHFKSLDINKKRNNKEAMASNYNDIGVVYKTLKEYDKALDSYKMANSLAEELQLTRGIIMTLNNIGTIYEAKDDYESALEYYNRAYTDAVRFQIPDAQAIVLNNLGDIYASKGNTHMARDYFRQTLAIDRTTGDRFGEIYSLINIAGTMIGSTEYDSSLYYNRQALKKSHELRANQQLFEIYSSLSLLYEEKHDFKNAYENLLNANIYQDSLTNESRQRLISEAEVRFEAKQKDIEIQLLKKEKLIKELEIQQRKSEITALLGAIVLGSLIIIFLYKRHQSKQLQRFNARLLQQKEAYLQAVVDAQEQERKRIASDLHDSVGQNLAAVKLGISSVAASCSSQPLIGTRLTELSQTLDNAVQEVRTISHQMMPRMLQEGGLVPAIDDMLEKSFRHSKVSYNFEHFGLNERLDEKIEIGLFRITQELINNIIKHSDATQISVQLLRNAKNLVLLVEDNGKGFELTKDKNQGIGLLNISSRVETIHGEFNLEPSPGSGTLATIRIPIK